MQLQQLEKNNYSASKTGDINSRVHKLMHICLQLSALGYPCQLTEDQSYLSVAKSLLRNYKQHRRLLSNYRCPADQRIQSFLNNYLKRNSINVSINLPGEVFNLNEPGLAREMSIPYEKNHYKSPLLESYRLEQGVLHNPASDRRTTKGVFHIVEGGLPVPNDKKEVPVQAYANLLTAALQPPDDLMVLPISAGLDKPINMWVSLLLRPEVRPKVEGLFPKKTMETRMFVPGSLVANLDFVESIFGNAGDPFLPEHDAALDIEHWTGHSGCIILAPHLTKLTKKSLGLPHRDDATDRQIKDKMYWQQEDELYNGGESFKLVCRDMDGVIVTLIADNYFGYSKKEIKSQISYSANLFGGCEEEHAGGALAFPRFNLGEVYLPRESDLDGVHTFRKLTKQLHGQIKVHKEGYATDKKFKDILYIPENTIIDMQLMHISWQDENNKQHTKPLLSSKTYVYPSGFSVQMKKHPHAPSWRLIGTLGEGTFCHKPSTVSGGGKSEISKSIQDLMISGPLFVGNFKDDFKRMHEIFNYDFSQRFRDKKLSDNRSLLSKKRSLGSVIRLLTPSSTRYTDEYNQWLSELPPNIVALAYMIKRFYKPEWEDNWEQHFSVDEVNGMHGHELKFNGRKLEASYLRVGTHSDGTWRLFKLRQDFVAAAKVQMEDDISASTVVPASALSGLRHDYKEQSIKLVHNCESRLFQRPDDAINRGQDKQTERDLAGSDNFISNFEPLTSDDAQDLVNDVVNFEKFTKPMRKLIKKAANAEKNSYFVSSAQPRIVNGKPSPNVRYLQLRPDLADPKPLYLAEVGVRLARGLNFSEPVYFPVDAVLQGRRNNPQDKKNGIRPLAVYNPIHYQQLPELFMDLICSLTGKSPSTTGAGSEGALTKGPFNALSTTADLNTALVSFILCGHDGFSTAAGYIGQNRKIDHDISMLIPEIWSRLDVEERQPDYLISKGYFKKLDDFEHNGENVLASRLGYRITERFVHAYFGKIFDSPMIVFDKEMLCPEVQDMDAYVDGINNIVEAHQRVAQNYIDDGTINDACPPLKALLNIMATGDYQGKTIEDKEIRDMFSRESLLQSDWYKQRLITKRQRDKQLWQMNQEYIKKQLGELTDDDLEKIDYLTAQKYESERMLKVVNSDYYLQNLQGTLGADWVHQDTF